MNGIILTNGDNIRAHPQRFKWFLLSASHLAKYGTDPRGQYIVLCLVVQYLWWSGVTTSRCLYTYPISTYGVRELPHTPYEALAGPPSERPREEWVHADNRRNTACSSGPSAQPPGSGVR